MTDNFRTRVLEAVREIPRGQTRTYKEIAEIAGNSRATRAVGTILKGNFDPEIPCHRVIRSDGTPGGYNRGTAEKIRKLVEEGVLSTKADPPPFERAFLFSKV